MVEDIRNTSHIRHEDIVALNFIRAPGVYVYRKYHKQGLRSHIMEALNPDDVFKQNKGEVLNGTRFYPWAKPLKMLRIFRTKFGTLSDAFEEIRKFKIVEKYLPHNSYAKSDEFIVDYFWNGNRDVILCGLQEYVEGEILNPWDLMDKIQFENIFSRMKVEKANGPEMNIEKRVNRFRNNLDNFITGVKKMILETNLVPDFAGVENLLITTAGDVKLVDINNISKVSFGTDILLDDKGYPVCDKSIEAISILETKLLDRPIDRTETIYKIFLDPDRMKDVKDLEEKFHRSLR